MHKYDFGKGGTLIAVLLVFVVSSILIHSFYGVGGAVLFSAVYLVILLLSKNYWLSGSYLKQKIALLLISVFGGINLAALGPAIPLIEALITNLLQEFGVEWSFKPPSNTTLIIVLASDVVVAFISYLLLRDGSVLGKNVSPIDQHLPDLDIPEKLEKVADLLREELKSIDRQTNWNMSFYTPLDAEVEVTAKGKKKRSIMDLLTAIRKSDEKLFVLLGIPGSGKSIALRKLCQDITHPSRYKFKKEKKIPIYVNLKEWQPERNWSEWQPPTQEEFYAFIYQNVINRGIAVKKVLSQQIGETETVYDRLFSTGHLYFVLDSFDEIPQILDEEDRSPLIDKVSLVIYQFLREATYHGSQGILSSRIYRKPTQQFDQSVTLEIRAFNEDKIKKTLERNGKLPDELERGLFKNRFDLLSLSKNPFSLGLLAEYIDNYDRLPDNKSEMFLAFFDSTLKLCKTEMEKRNLDKESVLKGSIEIAYQMLQQYGLEAKVSEMRREIKEYPIDQIIEILKYGKVGRGGLHDENNFSFSHRRFTEFLFVQKIISNDFEIDPTAIPTDSKMRDSLVLYCEVAPLEKATAIASFCWDVMNQAESPQKMEVVHCIRFLNEAFTNRPKCLNLFRDQLAEYVLNLINEKNTINVIKHAVESVGVLSEKDRQLCLVKAMNLGNYWIDDTAIKSCKTLNKEIAKELSTAIINIIEKEFFEKYPRRKNELSFSLGLSEIFSFERKYLRYKSKYDLLILPIFTSLLFVIAPKITLVFLGSYFGIQLLNYVFNKLFFYFQTNNMDILEIEYRKYIPVFITMSFLPFILPTKDLEDPTIYIYPESWTAANLIVLALLPIIFQPIYRYLLIPPKLKLSDETVRALKFLLIFSPVIPIAIWLNPILAPLVKENERVIMITFLAILGILILVAIVYSFTVISDNIIKKIKYLMKRVIYFFRDNKRLRLFKFESIESRKDIYDMYNSLHLEYSRAKFVYHLEIAVKSIHGEWPDPNFLSFSNDESKIRLAILEEKWLGLN